MNNWNDDQKLAIETTDKGVVVAAAAGSGKTTVLVERTIRMLADTENKLPSDKLVAVTFTNDAAGQLKRKLSDALEKKYRSETDREKKSWLKEQYDRLPLACISTIDSFCFDLVKSNLHLTDYRDGVSVIDENTMKALMEESFDEALDIMARERREDFDLLYDTLTICSADSIKKIGMNFYNFLGSLAFPDEWAEEALSKMDDEELKKNWIDAIAYGLAPKLDLAESLNSRLHGIIAPLKESKIFYDTREAVIVPDAEMIDDVRTQLMSGDWDTLLSIKTPKWVSLKRKPNGYEYSPDEILAKDEFDKVRKKSKDQITNIIKAISKIGEDIDTPLEKSKEIFKALLAYVQSASGIIRQEKLRRNVLEFSDIERLTIDLLVEKGEDGVRRRTALANEFRESGKYLVLMIDEFQDVNNLQDLIFKALSAGEGLDVLEKNVFVVGDIKQSIYRFRNTNPELFAKAKAACDESRSDTLKLVELKKNYRSRENIINFVNVLFSQIMSEEIGEVEYVGGERLEAGAKYPGEDPAVEVMIVDLEEEQPEEDDAAEEMDESFAVARKIRQMLDDGALVQDSETKEMRPCRMSDFCVLAKKWKQIAALEKPFELCGLSVAVQKEDGYMRSREISIMTDLLRIIDNPMKDIPMAGVMLSPLLGFTDDELTTVRSLCRLDTKYPLHIYQVILDICGGTARSEKEEMPELSEAIKEKCLAVKELISRFSFYSSGMTVEKLIRRIYDETDILAAASSFEDSLQKRANLRLLLKYAEGYASNGEGSVYGFIRYLEKAAGKKDLKQAVTTVDSGNNVNAMTIHKSKGLEYPIVILCGLGTNFNLNDIRKPAVQTSEKLGIGFRIYDRSNMTKTESLAFTALKNININRMLSEEIRLLYVALTRAKERLILPLTLKPAKGSTASVRSQIKETAARISELGRITPEIVRDCKSFLNWIACVLICMKGSEPFREIIGIDAELPLLPETANVIYTKVERLKSSEAGEKTYYRGSADSEAVERLIEGFSKPVRISNAAAKMTVTEITSDVKRKKLGEKNPMFYPNLPRLSDELTRLSASKKGTYTHLFMELADYQNCERSVREELNRLIDNGSFTKAQAEGVYVSAIEKFFGGEFYKRLKASPEIMREKKFLVDASELGLGGRYSDYLAEGSMLQGVADCIFSEGEGYVIVDYKTDNFKDISEVAEYRTQLELYKAALDLILDKPVTACYIYSFRLNEGVEIAL